MEFEIETLIINDEIEIGDFNLDAEKVYPELENLEITPKTFEQTFKSNLYGYDKVKVNAMKVNLQNKTITPNKEEQFVEPDEEFDGLSKVIIDPIPNEYITPVGTKEINSNGEYDVVEFANVNVNTPTPKVEQAKEVTITQNGTKTITPDEDKVLSSVEVTTNVDVGIFPTGTIDITTNGNYDVKEYANANVDVDMGDLPVINDASYLFYYGYRTDTMEDLIKIISPECTMFEHTFRQSNIVDAPEIDTSNAISFKWMFYTISTLRTVPKYNGQNCINISQMFQNTRYMTSLGGIKDLGKAFLTTAPANNSDYKLDISQSETLTVDSYINVLNNLYDIASKGCNVQQVLVGSNGLSKLEATEEGQMAIQNAIAKGWSVS